MDLTLRALGQAIRGSIDLAPTQIHLTLHLPMLLAKFASKIESQIQNAGRDCSRNSSLMMYATPLDEALTALGRADPTFNEEVRRRLRPVKDRFFQVSPRHDLDQPKDGLHTVPPYLTDPELRNVAIELAELALQRGINVNLACEPNGSTFLHECVLLRDSTIAFEAVAWLLAHGADPNLQRHDGQTPLSLALRLGRMEMAGLIRFQGGHR